MSRWLLLLIVLLVSPPVLSATPRNEVIPLIEMQEVPLTDAIRQLARTARLNVMLDPKLSEAPFAMTKVSFRWTDVTAREALEALLENHGLVIVESRPKRL